MSLASVESLVDKYEDALSANDGKRRSRMPNDDAVAKALLEKYGDSLTKQDQNIFEFVGTHWQFVEPSREDQLRVEAQEILKGRATYQKLDSILKLAKAYIKEAPAHVNLFCRSEFKINFKNGTLHFYKNSVGVWDTQLRSHDKFDYLPYMIPQEFIWESQAISCEVHKFVLELFEGEDDQDEKVRAIQQMFGACLLSVFPRIHILYGPPGTGKSTLIKLIGLMLGSENVCSVEPSEFEGFMMESMINKSVNIVNDINVRKPINDNQLKKIEDKIPVRIDRKFRTAVYAPLPAIHIFAGNDLPKSFEGVSGALERRMTLIEMKRSFIKSQYDKNFAEDFFSKNKKLIFQFSVNGALDILRANGHYVVPSSSVQKMAEWQQKSDIVQRFLNDIEGGECASVVVNKAEKIPRKTFYSAFSSWREMASPSERLPSRQIFFETLRKKGLSETRDANGYYFLGFKEVAGY